MGVLEPFMLFSYAGGLLLAGYVQTGGEACSPCTWWRCADGGRLGIGVPAPARDAGQMSPDKTEISLSVFSSNCEAGRSECVTLTEEYTMV